MRQLPRYLAWRKRSCLGRHRTQRLCGRQATRHCDRSTADEALLPAIAWSKGEATRGFLCTWTASLIVPGQHGTRQVQNPITDLVSSTTRSRQQDSRIIGAMLPASGILTVPVSTRSPLAEHACPISAAVCHSDVGRRGDEASVPASCLLLCYRRLWDDSGTRARATSQRQRHFSASICCSSTSQLSTPFCFAPTPAHSDHSTYAGIGTPGRQGRKERHGTALRCRFSSDGRSRGTGSRNTGIEPGCNQFLSGPTPICEARTSLVPA